MTNGNKYNIKHLLAAACLISAFSQPAAAFEVGGVKLDDTVQIAGKDLKLNGAGIRFKTIFKVYVVGLYLPEKKTTVADILNSQGPRRVSIVMLRDITSDAFGEGFLSGLNSNVDKVEKAKLLAQTMQFGQMFGLIPGLKKGDVLSFDWIPGIGTQCQWNGKKMGDILPDLAFYNAVLKIWIGDKPADNLLKPKLLGEPG